MNDPHVQRLHYTIGTEGDVSFGEPPPLPFSNELGHFLLKDARLAFEPAEHFSDVAEARERVEPFLRSWEIERDLKANLGSIRFKYHRPEVIDRNPPPPGSDRRIAVSVPAEVVMLGDIARAHLTQNRYPEPPTSFKATPDVETAHFRWRGYREHREPLQSMAYFILTLMESRAGGRREASELYQIDLAVLQKLGELTSARGDMKTARKLDNGSGEPEPLTGPEQAWIESTVRRIVLRMGELAAGGELPPLTMAEIRPELLEASATSEERRGRRTT